jgi:uncharacterized protein (TIGR03083 family)
MTRLAFAAYLDHIGSESARFRAALTGCDPTARVPACPDWDAADLLWHLAEVQWFWSRIIAGRPAGPDELEHPARPTEYDDLLAAFDTSSAGLLDALAHAEPTDVAWSWAPEQTVGFTFRRQAHEALIHRLDAEQTAGVPSAPLDPALAADGVEECLAVMYGGCPPWGRFTPDGRRVRIELIDVDQTIWVALGRFSGTDPDTDAVHDEDDLSVVADQGAGASATVRGTAAQVDTWLWDRSPASEVDMSGDPDAIAHLSGIVGQEIS